MDILNNIWTAISTPNERLISLLSIPITLFIEIPLSFRLICNIFKINYIKKQKVIYIIVTTIIALIANYLMNSPYNIILNYVSAFILIFFLFKLNIIKTLIASLIPSIIFSLLGNLLFNPYLSMFNLTCEQATTIPIYRIPFALSMYLIVFLLNIGLRFKNITLLDNGF